MFSLLLITTKICKKDLNICVSSCNLVSFAPFRAHPLLSPTRPTSTRARSSSSWPSASAASAASTSPSSSSSASPLSSPSSEASQRCVRLVVESDANRTRNNNRSCVQVIWTDFIQAIIMVIGALILMFKSKFT